MDRSSHQRTQTGNVACHARIPTWDIEENGHCDEAICSALRLMIDLKKQHVSVQKGGQIKDYCVRTLFASYSSPVVRCWYFRNSKDFDGSSQAALYQPTDTFLPHGAELPLQSLPGKSKHKYLDLLSTGESMKGTNVTSCESSDMRSLIEAFGVTSHGKYYIIHEMTYLQDDLIIRLMVIPTIFPSGS